MSAKKAVSKIDPSRSSGSDSVPCSRFAAARVEELLQARDNIAEGDRDMVTHADACDLVDWYADELDRVRMHYQRTLGDIALAALKGSSYPENAGLSHGDGSATPTKPTSDQSK